MKQLIYKKDELTEEDVIDISPKSIEEMFFGFLKKSYQKEVTANDNGRVERDICETTKLRD